MRQFLRHATLSATLLLGACTTLEPMPSDAIPANAPHGYQVARWTLNGKAGLTLLGQSVSITYSWQRQGNDFQTDAAGPLDQGYTTLVSRGGHVVLDNAWLGRHESDDAEGLAKALTNVAIPFNHLNAWLMGWPLNPATPVYRLAAPDGVRRFSEQGWQVRVAGEQLQNGHRLPTRVLISQGTTRFNILLATWAPGADGAQAAR